ncbi:MAG: hypothetical protein SW833_00710 [Cyanobacteriota bacterium]|nr:hypothetical protein [Cyanobacteriota bacterium]
MLNKCCDEHRGAGGAGGAEGAEGAGGAGEAEGAGGAGGDSTFPEIAVRRTLINFCRRSKVSTAATINGKLDILSLIPKKRALVQLIVRTGFD